MTELLVFGLFGRSICNCLEQDGLLQEWAVMLPIFIVTVSFMAVKFFPKLIILGAAFVVGGLATVITIIGGSLVLYLLKGIIDLLDEAARQESEMLANMSPEQREVYYMRKELKSIKDELYYMQMKNR